jgi:hypothetical protein
VYDLTEKRFIPAKELRRLMNTYIQQKNEMIERYNDEEEFKLSFDNEADEFEWFKESFLKPLEEYVIIQIPEHVGFGIMMPSPKEYVTEINEVLK